MPIIRGSRKSEQGDSRKVCRTTWSVQQIDTRPGASTSTLSFSLSGNQTSVIIPGHFQPSLLSGQIGLGVGPGWLPCPVSLKPPRIPLKHFPHLPRSKMTGQRCPTPREIMRQENMTSIRVQNIPQPSKMAPIVPRLGCSSRRRIYVAVYFVFGGVNGNTLGPKDIGTLVFSWPTASTGG